MNRLIWNLGASTSSDTYGLHRDYYYYYYYHYYYYSSFSSIDSTTLGGSWSVQQFYSTPVYPLPSPSNQQFSSSLGLLLPGPCTLTWVSLLVLFYMASILLFFWQFLYSPEEGVYFVEFVYLFSDVNEMRHMPLMNKTSDKNVPRPRTKKFIWVRCSLLHTKNIEYAFVRWTYPV